MLAMMPDSVVCKVCKVWKQMFEYQVMSRSNDTMMQRPTALIYTETCMLSACTQVYVPQMYLDESSDPELQDVR